MCQFLPLDNYIRVASSRNLWRGPQYRGIYTRQQPRPSVKGCPEVNHLQQGTVSDLPARQV